MALLGSCMHEQGDIIDGYKINGMLTTVEDVQVDTQLWLAGLFETVYTYGVIQMA